MTTNKSAFCLFGMAHQPELAIANITKNILDLPNFDFYAHANIPVDCQAIQFKSISNDPLDSSQEIYQNLTHSRATINNLISPSFVRTLNSLTTCLNMVKQQEQSTGQTYHSVVCSNWNIRYDLPYPYASLLSDSNVFYNGYISRYGFNHNWMQLDRTAFDCFVNLLDHLPSLAALDHPYQQPGDIVDMFCKQKNLVCQNVGHVMDLTNITIQPTALALR